MSPLWAVTNTLVRSLTKTRRTQFGVPVISVGNIVAGGVGKTEIAAAIAAHFIARSKRVVIASRGYGSRWEKLGGVAFDYDSALALGFPDESIVILKKVPGVAVAVGADRVSVLKKHWEELNPDLIILDDGFQHFKIARGLDVLVHDFSVRWPILRDLPIVLKKARMRISFSEIPKQWQPTGNQTPWIKVRYELFGVHDAAGKVQSLPKQAIAFCGLGNPKRFKRSLEHAGVQLKAFRTFSDHAVYDRNDIDDLVRWIRDQGGNGITVLTTLKDFVKLSRFVESQGGVAGFEPMWVGVQIKFLENEKLFWNTLEEFVDQPTPATSTV